MRAIVACLTVIWAAALCASPGFAQEQTKVSNVLARPLAASEAQFIEAALQTPAAGSCDVLSPDPGFVEEMLVRFGANGAKSYERRVALVVGNGAYRSIGTLTNPPNDAKSMAKMFRALGFTVYRAVDATEAALDVCFLKFKGDLEASDAAGAKADIALFFYAGHGVQLTSQADNEKRNYMLSVDAKVDAGGKAKGFRQVDAVLNEMRAHSKQAVFLYDACRNAPYGEGAVKEADGAAVRQFDVEGAAPIVAAESETASQAGLFIAYATSPGKTADDAWGAGSGHSPFTEALLKNLPEPGVAIGEALVAAQLDVAKLTAPHGQVPWSTSSLQTPLHLMGELKRDQVLPKSVLRAGQAENAMSRGQRGEALAAALKGMRRDWSSGAAAKSVASARIALARAYMSADVRFDHKNEIVDSAAFSPDGKRVVTSSNGAFVWDAATGRRLFKLGRYSSEERGRYDASGERIVTVAPRSVTLWNAATGAEIVQLTATDSLYDVALSPDGQRLVAGSKGGKAFVFDLETHNEIALLTDPAAAQPSPGNSRAGEVRSVAFSPDGARIVTASDNSAKIFDAATGALLHRLEHGVRVNSARFSPALGRNEIVTASNDGVVGIWNVGTGAVRCPLTGHARDVLSAAFSADGARIVTAGADDAAAVWDAASCALMYPLNGHQSRIETAEFSKDGKKIVTSSWDGTARIFLAPTGKEFLPLPVQSPLRVVAFSPDGERVLTASRDGTVKVSDAASGAPLFEFNHGSRIQRAGYSPDGKRIVTSSDDGPTKVWDAASGVDVSAEAALPDAAAHAAYSLDRSVLASAVANAVYVRKGAGAPTPLVVYDEGDDVLALALSHDGERVAIGRLDCAELWSVGTKKKLHEMKHGLWVNSVAFSRDPKGARLVTGSEDKLAKVWDSATGEELARLEGHIGIVETAQFNADGALVLTTADGNAGEVGAALWDAETGAWIVFQQGVEALDLSPDGKRLATAYTGQPNGFVQDFDLPYGPKLFNAAYALLTDDLRAEIERERIRYWEVDPALLE
ncbi:MAG: caspase family protein [Parvularculaceae bacterium]